MTENTKVISAVMLCCHAGGYQTFWHFWVLYVSKFLIKIPYSASSYSLYGLGMQDEEIKGFKVNYKLSYPNF